ncbi:MAG: DUF4838 domain-containing protein [Tannerellaceae bacterium]|jgi:hypothetical protein|nr:DUF4838 domain-containing protein [Tannerellaceae bacterium]
MKQLTYYVCILFVLSLCGCNPGLKINGAANYQIVIPSNADTIETRASQQLQRYLFEMSGTKLPIVEEAKYTGKNAIYLGQTAYAKALDLKLAPLKDDGYIYKSVGNNFVIAGGEKKGTLYGVYDLLETFGFRKYTSAAMLVPHKKAVSLPPDTEFIPSIVYRTTSYSDTRDREYAEWHKLSSRSEWGLFVHTFDRLVPPSEYMGTHPEYYSLRNGQRMPTQLCLSNPDVLRICIENLEKEIAQKPELKYWSVSQNDNDKYCLCDKCLALNETFGGDARRSSGSMIYFVNRVAKAFPDKMISTLAYWYTRTAPDHIIPEPNVNIMLCNIESKRNRPVFETDTAFSRDLRNWGKLAQDILIWDYNIQFSNLVSPFPNLHTIGPNLDFFTDNRVNSFFMQSNSQTGGEMAELRAYLISKLLWNPKADADAIIDDFVTGYFGAAGPFIRQYIDVMREALLESGFRLDIFGSPEAARESYLSARLMDRYNQLFDQAEKAVEQDTACLQRVRIARLPVSYAQIQISRTEVDTPRSLFQSDANQKITFNPEIVSLLNQFVEVAKKQGVNRLRERSISPDDYMASYQRIFKKVEDTREALSLNKTVIPAVEPSARYKGAGSLTDGIFGSYEDWRDVRFDNWVAYENSHIDFVLDLGEVKPVKYLNMDFFDAKDTWYTMALPRYVTYSFSADGKTYSDEIKVVNPVDPMEPEVDSMPRVIYVQSFEANTDRRARYINVHAESILKNPVWHVNAGGAAVMFCDEIVVK